MSLMFRKAILPRNVSLLKYFKGRPLATAANKKNNGVLSTAVPCHRNLKYKARPLRVGTVKTEGAKPLTPFKIEGRGGGEATRLRFCVSSPDIVPLSRTRLGGSPIISGPASSINYDTLLLQRTGSLPNVPCSYFHTSHYVSKCKPAPCPCPGCPGCCNCLPPPCNTPPKCIQYMTGYYYYPYGFWFCGPYHVTGTCVPAGPCSPGSPCGPCCGPPCPPCGPCGPCCSPCPPPPPPKPKCPCPKCCTCLNPISTAVVGGDPEPRCQSVQVPPVNPKSESKPIEVSYPLPRVDPPQRERAPTPHSKGGISKFFPFNAVPALVPATRVPHSSVHVCPYSTQPLTQSCPQTQYSGCTRLYPEHNPVYCTPCIKARTRPRMPPSYYFSEKAKKSNYYEKRSESRSPIHHKRVKRVNCELCSVLENPRGLLTKEQRDKPATFPGTFQYTNIPNYKNPFPSQPNKDTSDYREYETKTE